MSTFTDDEIHKLVDEVVSAACAPKGSRRYASVPVLIKPLFESGDSDDALTFLCGVTWVIIDTLGLGDDPLCPHGDPEHVPYVTYGYVAHDPETGQMSPERSYDGDPAHEPPMELAVMRPEVVAFTRLMFCELNHRAETCETLGEIRQQTWFEALRGGYAVDVIRIAILDAASVRSLALAAGRVN